MSENEIIMLGCSLTPLFLVMLFIGMRVSEGGWRGVWIIGWIIRYLNDEHEWQNKGEEQKEKRKVKPVSAEEIQAVIERKEQEKRDAIVQETEKEMAEIIASIRNDNCIAEDGCVIVGGKSKKDVDDKLLVKLFLERGILVEKRLVGNPYASHDVLFYLAPAQGEEIEDSIFHSPADSIDFYETGEPRVSYHR